MLCEFVWDYSLKYFYTTLSINILLRTSKLAPPDFSPAVCFASASEELWSVPCRQTGASPACLGSSVSTRSPQARCTHKIYALHFAQRKDHSKSRKTVSSVCPRPTYKDQVGTMELHFKLPLTKLLLEEGLFHGPQAPLRCKCRSLNHLPRYIFYFAVRSIVFLWSTKLFSLSIMRLFMCEKSA